MNKEKLSNENEDLRVRMREGDKLLATCQDELDHYREKVGFIIHNYYSYSHTYSKILKNVRGLVVRGLAVFHCRI